MAIRLAIHGLDGPRRITITTAFIQARMSSRRFPGKVLKPFLGRPIVRHVIDTVRAVDQIDRVVVVTSDHESDHALVDYLRSIDCDVFRGPLEDVFQRFRLAIQKHPDDWMLRLCADSPLLSGEVVRVVTECRTIDPQCDVVTTRFSPPFPKGQNAELIRTETFLNVDMRELSDHDREHVTPWFYRHRERYNIVDARPVDLHLPAMDYTVDTPEDLQRLETVFAENRSDE